MANLYDKAGLVNIPVGYQDGFLYNIKPEDNTLGFRFNRDSAATRVNKEGLIEQVGYFGPELVTNGTFDNNIDNWSAKSSVISWSNGKLSCDNSSGNSSAGPYQANVWVDTEIYKVTVTMQLLSGDSDGNIRVLSSSSTGSSQSTLVTGNQLTIGGNAVTQTFYLTPASSDVSIQFACNSSNAVFTIDNVSVKEVLGNKPRIDYTDSLTSPSFLLEPQSTNVLENSEITSTWTYTEFGSGSTGTITTGKTDMFGGTNAVQIDFPSDAENVTLAFGQSTSSISSGSASGSVYIKLIESGSKTLQLRCSPGLTTLINVDETKFVRYELSGTKNNSEALTLKLRPSLGTSSGGFSIIVCQPQEEALSYPTSYIPTAGSTVTRAQETCNGAGNASTFNDSEGVLYCDIAALADDLTFRAIGLSDGTTNNRVLLRYRTTSNQINLFIRANSTTIVNSTKALTDITNYSKIALKYKSGDIALWVDGQEVKTNTNTFTLIGLDRLSFDAGNGSDDFYGKVKGVYVFNEALTDDELQQLTGPEYNSFAALAAAYNYTVI